MTTWPENGFDFGVSTGRPVQKKKSKKSSKCSDSGFNDSFNPADEFFASISRPGDAERLHSEIAQANKLRLAAAKAKNDKDELLYQTLQHTLQNMIQKPSGVVELLPYNALDYVTYLDALQEVDEFDTDLHFKDISVSSHYIVNEQLLSVTENWAGSPALLVGSAPLPLDDYIPFQEEEMDGYSQSDDEISSTIDDFENCETVNHNSNISPYYLEFSKDIEQLLTRAPEEDRKWNKILTGFSERKKNVTKFLEVAFNMRLFNDILKENDSHLAQTDDDLEQSINLREASYVDERYVEIKPCKIEPAEYGPEHADDDDLYFISYLDGFGVCREDGIDRPASVSSPVGLTLQPKEMIPNGCKLDKVCYVLDVESAATRAATVHHRKRRKTVLVKF